MANSVEFYFDEKAEAVLRSVWAMIDAAGVAGACAPGIRPHVTLARIDGEVSADLMERITAWAQSLPSFEILLSGCGTFPACVFLAPRPSVDLLESHARLQQTLLGTPGVDPSFGIARWIPTADLAVGLDETALAEATAVARTVALPIAGRVVEVGVVEDNPPRLRASFPLRVRART